MEKVDLFIMPLSQKKKSGILKNLYSIALYGKYL